MLLELRAEITRLLPQLKEGREGTEVVDNMIGILEGKKWLGLDFPHQPHHNLRVFRDTQCISALQHLEPWEKDLLEKGSIVHDFGRNFVEKGLIEENEHQNGSFVLAKAISSIWWGFPENLANYFSEGVALHIEDVLPKNTPRWARVLRDSDRTSRLGIGGIIESAWYLGYRDTYISEASAEQMTDDQLLFDLEIPVAPEDFIRYDEKPRKYLIENILPFLVKNDKLQDLANRVDILLDRIYGVSDDKKRKKHAWIIEPVSKEAQFLSAPRITSMNRVLKEVGLSVKARP